MVCRVICAVGLHMRHRTFLHLAAGAAALPVLPRLALRWVMRTAAASVAFAILVALPSDDLLAQSTQSIRLVIPYAAGGINDAMTRVLADHIGRVGGPPFVIENRPGAGTVVATDAVSRATPDGNTMLLVGNSFVINPQVQSPRSKARSMT